MKEILITKEVKAYQCEECGYVSTCSFSMRNHENEHEQEVCRHDSVSYACKTGWEGELVGVEKVCKTCEKTLEVRSWDSTYEQAEKLFKALESSD